MSRSHPLKENPAPANVLRARVNAPIVCCSLIGLPLCTLCCLYVCYLNDSCPGVSIINIPGILKFSFSNWVKIKGKKQI